MHEFDNKLCISYNAIEFKSWSLFQLDGVIVSLNLDLNISATQWTHNFDRRDICADIVIIMFRRVVYEAVARQVSVVLAKV